MADINDYINSQLDRGISREQIAKTLLDNRWNKDVVDEAFKLVDEKNSKVKGEFITQEDEMKISKEVNSKIEDKKQIFSTIEENHKNKILPTKKVKLPGIVSTLQDSLHFYRAGFFSMILLAFAFLVVFYSLKYGSPTLLRMEIPKIENSEYVLGIALNVVEFCFFVWFIAASMLAIIKRIKGGGLDDNSAAMLTPPLFSIVWVSFLCIFIVIAFFAIILCLSVIAYVTKFYINISIPVLGWINYSMLLICGLWYVLALFALLSERRMGIDAIVAARGYAKNSWISISTHAIFLALFYWGATTLIRLATQTIPTLSPAIMILFLSFFLSYLTCLCSNIKNLKEPNDHQSSDRYLRNLALFCSFGVVIITAVLIFIIDDNPEIELQEIKRKLFFYKIKYGFLSN